MRSHTQTNTPTTGSILDAWPTGPLLQTCTRTTPIVVLLACHLRLFPFSSLSLGSLLERGVVQTKRGCLYLSLKVDKDEKQQAPLKLNYNSTTLFSFRFFLSHSQNPVALFFFWYPSRGSNQLGRKGKNIQENKVNRWLRRSIVCDEALRRGKLSYRICFYTTPSTTFLEEGEAFKFVLYQDALATTFLALRIHVFGNCC